MEADASAAIIGATLFQDHGILGIYSKKLNKFQINHTNTERELLAIIEALRHFRSPIYRAKIIIRTDYINLLHSPELQTSRAQRWKLLLAEYDIKLEYLKGKGSIAADALSRCLKIAEELDKAQINS